MKKILLAIFLLLTLSNNCWAVNWCDDVNTEACWIYSEGSGATVDDSSANSNTATLVGDSYWSAISGTNAPSYATYMVTVDGVDDYLLVLNDASLVFGNDSFSFTGWALLVTTPGDSFPAIIGKGDTGVGEWMLRNDGTNSSFYADAGDISSTESTSAKDNSWHHWGFVVNQTTGVGAVWFDGIEGTIDSSFSSNFTDTTDLILGNADGDTARFWDGSLSESFLIRYALDSTDINDIMTNGLVQSTASSRRFMQL